ncbi:unnamed protein product, partial [Tetraodon nigroviridis]
GADYESLPPHVPVMTHMTAGAVAGILEHTVMYPVDSVKTRMQSLQPDPNAQYRGVYEALKRIIQTEGIFRPLRGLNVTMLGAGPAHALYFACYERVKYSLSDIIQNGGNSHVANGVAGSLATVLHDAVMNPAEVIKQRMQMYNSPYRGLWDCIQTVTRAEGVGTFYRSYSTQLTMNIPFQAVHFITYELMQEQLNPHRHYHPGSHIISGAAAGAVSAAVTTPLDVCKTHAEHPGERGAHLREHQRPLDRNGERLQNSVPTRWPGGFLQRRPGSGHLPDALHRHRLVSVRVLQVLSDQAAEPELGGTTRAEVMGGVAE